MLSRNLYSSPDGSEFSSLPRLFRSHSKNGGSHPRRPFLVYSLPVAVPVFRTLSSERWPGPCRESLTVRVCSRNCIYCYGFTYWTWCFPKLYLSCYVIFPKGSSWLTMICSSLSSGSTMLTLRGLNRIFPVTWPSRCNTVQERMAAFRRQLRQLLLREAGWIAMCRHVLSRVSSPLGVAVLLVRVTRALEEPLCCGCNHQQTIAMFMSLARHRRRGSSGCQWKPIRKQPRPRWIQTRCKASRASNLPGPSRTLARRPRAIAESQTWSRLWQWHQPRWSSPAAAERKTPSGQAWGEAIVIRWLPAGTPAYPQGLIQPTGMAWPNWPEWPYKQTPAG